MSRKQVGRAVRGGLRAVTGIVIVAAAAVGAVLAGSVPLPAIERQPIALTVDTLQGAERQFVCPGSFAVLGADPSRPGIAIPTGVASIVFAGQPSAQRELATAEAGGSNPVVLTASAAEPVAAAQSQAVQTDTLRGLTAASCAEPVNEQWLVGGATTVGASTTLSLGNPFDVPATVQLTVYDENGQVDSAQTTGVLVPAGGERTVSLNGYAPGRERLAVRVDSTGAAVTASLGVSEVTGLDPFAVDTVAPQLSGETTLVVPGIANLNDHEHGPGDTLESDAFPVLVRVLSTTGQNGTASVRALSADGTEQILGEIDLVGAAVGELSIEHWPEGADAVVVESTVPVVGGALGSANAGPQHDYAWVTAAPQLPTGIEVPAAVIPGGELVLANSGSSAAEVRIVGASLGGASGGGAGDAEENDGENRESQAVTTITVPAGATAVLSAPVAVMLSSTAPVHAAVRLASGGDIAVYPVLAPPEQASSLTVYPR